MAFTAKRGLNVDTIRTSYNIMKLINHSHLLKEDGSIIFYFNWGYRYVK